MLRSRWLRCETPTAEDATKKMHARGPGPGSGFLPGRDFEQPRTNQVVRGERCGMRGTHGMPPKKKETGASEKKSPI